MPNGIGNHMSNNCVFAIIIIVMHIIDRIEIEKLADVFGIVRVLCAKLLECPRVGIFTVNTSIAVSKSPNVLSKFE